MPAEEIAPSAASYAHMTQDRGKPFRLAGDTISVHRQNRNGVGPIPGAKTRPDRIIRTNSFGGGNAGRQSCRGEECAASYCSAGATCRPEMQPVGAPAGGEGTMADWIRRAMPVVAGLTVVLLAGPGITQGNIDAGKTPAQIFSDTCAACHKRPQELRRPSASFLRQHYTTGSTEASAMAAYLAAVGSDAKAAEQRKERAKAQQERIKAQQEKAKAQAQAQAQRRPLSKGAVLPKRPSSRPSPLRRSRSLRPSCPRRQRRPCRRLSRSRNSEGFDGTSSRIRRSLLRPLPSRDCCKTPVANLVEADVSSAWRAQGTIDWIDRERNRFGRSLGRLRLSAGQHDGTAQIERDAEQVQLALVLDQTEPAHNHSAASGWQRWSRPPPGSMRLHGCAGVASAATADDACWHDA